MYSSALGATDRMIFRNFSNAARWSLPRAARYSSTLFGVAMAIVLSSVLAAMMQGFTEPARGQDDAEHHDRARHHGRPDRLPGHAVARGPDQGPGREGQIEKRRGVAPGRDAPLHERREDVEDDAIDQRGRGNDEAQRRPPPPHTREEKRGDHEDRVRDQEPRGRHYDAQGLSRPILPAGEVLLGHVEGAGRRDHPERPLARPFARRRRGRHATCSVRPGSNLILDAYSIWSTRRGAGAADLDDAWTSSGRITSTPPRATMHSWGSSRATSSWMPASERTPSS